MNKRILRIDLLIDFLILSCGAAIALGPGMDAFLPHLSDIYPVLSAAVFITMTLKYCLHRRLKVKDLKGKAKLILDKSSKSTVLFSVYWIIVSGVTLIQLVTLKNQSFIEALKTPLFAGFSYMIGTSLRERRRRVSWMLAAYAFSFCLTFLLFGEGIQQDGLVRKIGTQGNPNIMARDATLAIFACIYLISVSRHWTLVFPMLMIAGYALMASGSRGPLMGLMLGLLYLAIMKYGKLHWKKLTIAFSLLVLMLVLVFVALDPSAFGARVTRLFMGSSQFSSFSNNLRLRIWSDYLSRLPRYLWLGMDMNKYAEISTHVTHNAFLFNLVSFGVFAFLSYLALQLYVLFAKPTATKGNAVLKAAFIAFFVSDLFIDSFSMRTTRLVMVFAVFIVSGAHELHGKRALGKSTIAIVRRDMGTFGGIEHQIYNLMTSFSHDSTVIRLVSDNRDSELFQKASALGSPICMSLEPSIKNAVRLAEFCFSDRVDILQTHMFRESLLMRLVKFYYPELVTVFRVHTYIDCSHISALRKNLYHFMAWCSDFLVDHYSSINHYNEKELAGRSRVSPRKISVVSDAIPEPVYVDNIETRVWPPKQLAMVSHFVPHKGHEVLVEGISILKNRGLNISACLIGGNGQESGTEKRIRDLVEKLEVGNLVSFYGATNDVPSALADYSIVVLPSDSEGTPNSLLEAMSMMKVVIASDVGGVSEFIVDGSNGFLHPAQSPQMFAEAVMKVLSIERSLMTQVSKNAHQTWTQFAPRNVFKMQRQVYEELLDSME